MKKITLSIIITLFALVYIYAQSGCLPEGIAFTTQEEIDNFQINYPGCTEIEGDVLIGGENYPYLTEITNLEGLSVITSIGGDLMIAGNESLTSLTGLENLESVGGGFSLGFYSGWYEENIDNPSLTNLSALSSLSFIGGFFSIAGNDSLTSLEGLESLTEIGSGFHIFTSFLTSLTGLENLTSIGGEVSIGENLYLTSLSGLENLTTIGDFLGIWSNNELTSLSGLENLTSIGGGLLIDNNVVLTSLSGLDNIDPNSIEILRIQSNDLMSECDIQSICEYLAAPNGFVWIESNFPGCNSIGEVEEACNAQGIEDRVLRSLTIQPNPSANGIIIITLDNLHNLRLTCFNTFGQQVHQEEISSAETVINVSTWTPGIYLAVVYEDGKPVGRNKFVVR